MTRSIFFLSSSIHTQISDIISLGRFFFLLPALERWARLKWNYHDRNSRGWSTSEMRTKARWPNETFRGPSWAPSKSNVILKDRRPFLIRISSCPFNPDPNRPYHPKAISISAAPLIGRTTCPNLRWNASVIYRFKQKKNQFKSQWCRLLDVRSGREM